MVVVVEDLKTQVAPVTNTVQAQHQVGQLLAVHPFTGEHAEGAGRGHTLFKTRGFVPHEVGQLHQEDTVRVEVVDGVERCFGGKHMERVQAQPEVRAVCTADHVPGGGELVHRAAPRQTFVRHLDAQRQGQHGEFAQVARNHVQVLCGVARGGRTGQQHLAAECGAHLQHRLGDVHLVRMQVARQSFEVAQHLETRGAQTTGAHHLHRRGQALRVAHHVTRAEHHLRKTHGFHGGEFGLQRPCQGDGVHAIGVEHMHSLLLTRPGGPARTRRSPAGYASARHGPQGATAPTR